MNSLARLCLSWGLVAQAAPLPGNGALEIRGNEHIHITTGEPARDRTMFSVISVFCTAVLSFLLGMMLVKNHALERRVLTCIQDPGYID
jgi:hypothetical protein